LLIAPWRPAPAATSTANAQFSAPTSFANTQLTGGVQGGNANSFIFTKPSKLPESGMKPFDGWTSAHNGSSSAHSNEFKTADSTTSTSLKSWTPANNSARNQFESPGKITQRCDEQVQWADNNVNKPRQPPSMPKPVVTKQDEKLMDEVHYYISYAVNVTFILK
jgi:hypothetical protein